MSYTTGLLLGYPSSSLLSDDYIQRSTLGSYYQPSVSYLSNSSRLLSSDLPYNPVGFGQPTYRSSVYSYLPITDWRREIPQHNSYSSTNDIREYSESLGTTSNTTTASTVARSINENNQNLPTTKFHNYQSNYNRSLNTNEKNSYVPSVQKTETNEEKSSSTHRSIPVDLSTNLVEKHLPIEETKTEKQENHSEQKAPVVNEQPSADIETWLNDVKEEKVAEQAWTVKIDHLQTTKVQRQKDKIKAARALPNIPKKTNLTKGTNDSAREVSFQMRNGSYFDSLFDGNFVRKNSTAQQNINSSNRRPSITRYQPIPNSSYKPKTTILSKSVPTRTVSQYEPPSFNRHLPGKKIEIKQNSKETLTPRENIHKDADERFHEALNKFRTDRAEQQQRDANESTAKRLDYGDYVRHSTKDHLLQNAIKPSPWSDFMDLKKGNLYSLTKQEKKDLYYQSRSYGERVRHRNMILHQAAETARTEYRSIPLPVPNIELRSGDETSREPEDDDNSSESTVKSTGRTYIKQNLRDELNSKESDRTTSVTNQTSVVRPSEDEDESVSDFDLNQKSKKNFRYPNYDSSVRTSVTEESEHDEGSEQTNSRMKFRDTDDDLFTVKEEKTFESLEKTPYKKPIRN